MNIFSAGRAIVPGFLMVATATLIGCSSSSSTATGTGGVTGAGGSAGRVGTGGAAGGSTGTGGATTPPALNYTFDAGPQGFMLSTYADFSSVNLAATYPAPVGTVDASTDAGTVDAGTDSDGGTAAIVKPTLVFDSTVGDPAPGSLKVTVTFTDYGQYVDPVVNLPLSLDLTGKVVHARLARSSGEFSGGAQLHLSTGLDFGSYAQAPFVISPTLGTFTNAMIDLTTAISATGVLNPAVVVQVGVQIFSGSAVPGVPYPNAGMPVVFNIDTITD